MFDTSVILNLHYFKRDSYISVICQASKLCRGRQKSRCGRPPSGVLGVKKRKTAFRGTTKDKGQLREQLFFWVFKEVKM